MTFIGHDEVGAQIIAGICRRLRVSRKLTTHLQGLALHHLRLGFLIHQRPLSRRAVYDYLVATEPVSADVTLLSVADRLAARGEGPLASPEMVEAHLDLAREMLRDALAWHRDGPPRPPISGDELAAELGLEPGPEMGTLLEELRAEAFTGEISGRGRGARAGQTAPLAGAQRPLRGPLAVSGGRSACRRVCGSRLSFCGIVAGSIPSETIDSDERTVAFMDINPATPGHALVVPREHSADLLEVGRRGSVRDHPRRSAPGEADEERPRRGRDQPDQRLRSGRLADRLPLPHPRRAPIRG